MESYYYCTAYEVPSSRAVSETRICTMLYVLYDWDWDWNGNGNGILMQWDGIGAGKPHPVWVGFQAASGSVPVAKKVGFDVDCFTGHSGCSSGMQCTGGKAHSLHTHTLSLSLPFFRSFFATRLLLAPVG